MKKTLLAALLCLFVAATLVSCKKDDDGGKTPTSLTGTKWKTAAMPDGEGVTLTMTIDFKTATTATLRWDWLDTSDGETDYDTEDYSYVYDEPNITLTNIEYPDEVVDGTVNGNRMSLDGGDDDVIVFTKQ